MKINYIGDLVGRIGEKQSFELLLRNVDTKPLDPTFENYANFVEASGFNEGELRVWGNFYRLNLTFSIDGQLEELDDLIQKIRTNQQTKAYRIARIASRYLIKARLIQSLKMIKWWDLQPTEYKKRLENQSEHFKYRFDTFNRYFDQCIGFEK